MISRLALLLYRTRLDLQKAFPDPLGTDQAKFARWFCVEGAREFELHPSLVRPVSETLGWRGRLRAIGARLSPSAGLAAAPPLPESEPGAAPALGIQVESLDSSPWRQRGGLLRRQHRRGSDRPGIASRDRPPRTGIGADPPRSRSLGATGSRSHHPARGSAIPDHPAARQRRRNAARPRNVARCGDRRWLRRRLLVLGTGSLPLDPGAQLRPSARDLGTDPLLRGGVPARWRRYRCATCRPASCRRRPPRTTRSCRASRASGADAFVSSSASMPRVSPSARTRWPRSMPSNA